MPEHSHASMLLCHADPLEVLHLSGVCRHLATDGAAEPDAEHRQLDRELHLPAGVSLHTAAACWASGKFTEHMLQQPACTMCSLPLFVSIAWLTILRPTLLLRRSYRGLYILNWIYRYFTESHYRHQWAGKQTHGWLPLRVDTSPFA